MNDMQEWQSLKNSSIWRKHQGDIDGAIELMVKAIRLTRTVPNLTLRTATMLNYLAVELYSTKNAFEQAEEAIREAVELSRSLSPGILADNLWVLAGIQSRKEEHREAMATAEEARHLYQQQGSSYGVARAEELIEIIKTKLR